MKLGKLVLIGVLVVASFGLTRDAQAINWSRCHVEQGETSIPTGSATATVTLTTSITDLTSAFILSQATGTSAVQGANNHRVAATLTSSTEATFTRVGTSGDAYVSYSVVQCYEDEFEVYTGTIALASGQASNTGTITGGPVTQGDSIVLVATTSNAIGANDSSSAVTAVLEADGSTVTIQRATAASIGISAYYQVIAFTADAIDRVQTGEVTLSSGLSSTPGELTYAVDTTRSWVLCSSDATNNGLMQTTVACYLSDSNTVAVQRGSAAAYTNRVRYYVVTWPENSVTVQTGSESIDPTAADGTRVDHDLTLTALDDINRSFPYMTLNVTGTSSTYPRNAWSYYIISTTTLRTSFWRSDAASNTDANYKYWQIISFPAPYQATGWGWIGNSLDGANGVGLISFSCENLTGVLSYTDCGDGTAGTRYDYGVQLELGGCGAACDVSGIAWLGTYSSSDGTFYPTGIIDFDPAISGVATSAPAILGDDANTPNENENAAAHWNEETGELYGWARFRSLQDYETNVLGSTRDNWGWIRLRGTTTSTTSSEYGVRFDIATEAFSGWAWNDNGTDAAGTEIDGSGFGWLKFDLNQSGATVTDAWFKTSQGDFYSQGGVNASIDAVTYGDYGATYLIMSAGDATTLVNFQPNTSLGATVTNTNLGAVPTDNGSNVFRGDLGSIYVNELILEAQEDGNGQTGNCDDTWLDGETNPLGGEVFYCSGDLTIDHNLTFYNASGSGIGSGTIVVGGDLYINDNMNYFNATIDQHINNLASVAFIVLGRLEIDPSVTQLVGTYIVLGDSHTLPSDPYDFATGDGTLPLELAGLVLARSFNFQRTNIGSAVEPEPAEHIYYDGRVIANSPPGLEDFTSTFPQP